MKTETTDYAVTVAKQRIAAIDADAARLNETYTKFREDSGMVAEKTISAVNLAREMGITLQAMAGGHDKVSRSFWHDQCQNKLAFDFEAAKRFVAIARKLEEPAQTLAQCRPALQLMFESSGFVLVQERAESHFAVNISPVQRLIDNLTTLAGLAKKAGPVEGWSDSAKSDFLAETQYLGELREKVEASL